MDTNLEDILTNRFRTLDNGLTHKLNEFKEFWSETIFKISGLKTEVDRLNHEKKQLLAENHKLRDDNREVFTLKKEFESLQSEASNLSEEKEMMRTELMEVRNENDMLWSRINRTDSLTLKAMEFAKSFLQTNNVNGIVNSLPAFSEQMVLTDKSNSLTSSLVNMEGMRLRTSESKEETYHSTRMASGQTSNETYYDAIGSLRSSLTNGSTDVRPKLQQNHISSTVCAKTGPTPMNVNEVLNESMITGLTDSTNYYIDLNNNLRLKSVKVPIARLMRATMAYAVSPSDFWLQIKPTEVNDYIHVIQVQQIELRNQPNSDLTAADIELGMYCAAIYSVDGYWYRAQIIGITYDHPIEKDSVKSVRILYIDWGNSEDRLLSHLMKLALSLNERRQAINCYVQGSGYRSNWSKQAIEDFERHIKDKTLKATFNRPHKVDECLDSIVYPIDLMFESENGSNVNIIDFLTIPNTNDEEINKTIEVNDNSVLVQNDVKSQSADTVVCNHPLNGHSNPTLSSVHSKTDSKQKSLEIKSKSNQNFQKSNVGLESNSRPNVVPKSMPQLNGFPSNDVNATRIPPPIIPDTNQGLIVEASHCETPTYMYLQIRDEQVGSAQFEDLEDTLNAFYSKHEPFSLTQPQDVKVGSFWANRFSRDNKWYRCRVLKIVRDKALVNYVDWGNEEWVDVNSLMHLTRQFANYPAMAVRCRLSNLFPISGQWSEESLSYFADLIANERTPPLTAFIAHKPDVFDFDSFIEVFLWTNDSNNDDVLVNLQLVANKFAATDNNEWVIEAERGVREKTPPELMSELIPIINSVNTELINGIHSSPPKITTVCTPVLSNSFTDLNGSQSVPKSSPVPNGVVPKVIRSTNKVNILPELPDISDDDDWDPMVEDAASDYNNYNIRPNDAGIATTGFHVNDMKTCKYFGTPKGCRVGNYCSFLHVAPDKRFSFIDTEEEMTELEEPDLPVGSTVAFKLTSAISPYCFNGILPFGSIQDSELNEETPYDKSLEQISVSLKTKYSKDTDKENMKIFPAIGSLVAFRDEKTDTYYRGRVLETIFDHKICVIFAVDLGTEWEVKRNQIFKLGKYFCQLPALAIQCSLTGIQPLNTVKWSEQSVTAFKEWLADRIVWAQILKSEGKYYIELTDKEDEKECRISDKLIEYKFANPLETSPANDCRDEIYDSDSDSH